MREKLGIDEFRKIKNNIISIINMSDNNDEFKTEEELQSFYNGLIQQIVSLNNRLSSSDLSNIPPSEWDGMILYSDKNHFLDLSKTNANIDISLVEFETNISFKSCHIINLDKLPISKTINESMFDEETKKEYENVFLSNNFSDDFKDKFYNGKITISSLAELTDEELQEVKRKKLLNRIDNFRIVRLIEVLGIEKIIDLYKNNYESYEAINYLYTNFDIDFIITPENSSFMTSEEFEEKLKITSKEDIPLLVSIFLKDYIIRTNSERIIQEKNDLPSSIKPLIDSYFLYNQELDDDVKNRFFNHSLSIEDVINNIELFDGINLEYYLENQYLVKILRTIKENRSEQLKENKNLFIDLNNYRNAKFFASLIEEDTINGFYDAKKKYFKNITKEKSIELMKYFAERYSFNLMDGIHSIDDLLGYDSNNTIIINNGQDYIINLLGIKNILRIEKEIPIFTNQNMYFLNTLAFYFHYNPNLKETFRFSKNSETDFNNQFELLLSYLSSNETYYNSFATLMMDYNFQKLFPNLAMSMEAPKELIEKYNKKEITIDDYYNEKYNSYLSSKKLGFVFKNPIIRYKNKPVFLYDLLEEYYSKNEALEYIKRNNDIINIVINSAQNQIIIDEDFTIETFENAFKTIFEEKIINYYFYDYDKVPKELKEKIPNLFLSDDAPIELQQEVMNRTCTFEFLERENNYSKYITNLDPRLLSISIYRSNIYLPIKNILGNDTQDIFLKYGYYIEQLINLNIINKNENYSNLSKEELIDYFDKKIEENIINGSIKYNEKLPLSIQEKNSYIMLPKDTTIDIKEKFYSKKLTFEDFQNNEALLVNFSNTYIIYGFDKEYSWMKDLYINKQIMDTNVKCLKIIKELEKIDDIPLKEELKDYILENKDNINFEKLKTLSELFQRILVSNSKEIYNLRKSIAKEIINTNDPISTFLEIEKIFIKNNLPTIGKIYSCFELLYKDFNGFNFEENSKLSPELKIRSNRAKSMIIFSDLVKASLGSNNRSVINYLNNLKVGNTLYESIKNGDKTLESLNNEELQELISFEKKVQMLYINTLQGQNDENLTLSDDIIGNLDILKKKLRDPLCSDNYNLGDRLVKMFFQFVGIETIDEALNYINSKIKRREQINIKRSEQKVEIKKNDLIKGIGDIKYLSAILQNGSVAKEFLGSDATSDLTPLDTDVSMVLNDGTIEEMLSSTAASLYGPIWFVLKNDDRFITTRSDNKDNPQRDYSKLELFKTGVVNEGHFGIRTGFASSNIDYILVDDNNNDLLEKIKVEIVLNGFYIPVINKEGNVIFSFGEYQEFKNTKNGLSFYGSDEYKVSPNIKIEECHDLVEGNLIDENERKTKEKRNKIESILKDAFSSLGLTLKTTGIDGDLSQGIVEIIDTGSTGRGTNKINDGDFDFMIRLDKRIMANDELFQKVVLALQKRLDPLTNEEDRILTNSKDFRYKNVQLDEETMADIDLSFTVKTDKISYSTDMALKDRLNTIRKQNEEEYKYVIANILLAKKVLKDAHAYKPNRGETPQGGLGGVGIENWILNHGGSFIDAAVDFITKSEGKSYSEFKKENHLWDFGENHIAEKKGLFPHDDFIESNMSEAGYERMRYALKKFLLDRDISKEEIEESVNMQK